MLFPVASYAIALRPRVHSNPDPRFGESGNYNEATAVLTLQPLDRRNMPTEWFSRLRKFLRFPQDGFPTTNDRNMYIDMKYDKTNRDHVPVDKAQDCPQQIGWMRLSVPILDAR